MPLVGNCTGSLRYTCKAQLSPPRSRTCSNVRWLHCLADVHVMPQTAPSWRVRPIEIQVRRSRRAGRTRTVAAASPRLACRPPGDGCRPCGRLKPRCRCSFRRPRLEFVVVGIVAKVDAQYVGSRTTVALQSRPVVDRSHHQATDRDVLAEGDGPAPKDASYEDVLGFSSIVSSPRRLTLLLSCSVLAHQVPNGESARAGRPRRPWDSGVIARCNAAVSSVTPSPLAPQ